MDRNTEQWVNDQNKFWEKKRGSLEKSIPKVFEPQGPVKILQRGKQPQSEVAKQTPMKTGVIEIFGTVVMVGPIIEVGIRWGILVKIGIGNKGMDMVEGMAMGIKISREGPMEGLLLKLKHITPLQKGRVPYGNTPSRKMGGGQGNGDGNGEDKDDKNRKKYMDTKYNFKEDEEESDTEDSFEFEITPQQLSQVTPGGGVLK